MQFDLAQKNQRHFDFFLHWDNFFDKFSNFWPCKCPTIFFRETVVNKRIRIIKGNYHMGYLAFDWMGSESRKKDFYDFFQTMACNVRLLLRPCLSQFGLLGPLRSKWGLLGQVGGQLG